MLEEARRLRIMQPAQKLIVLAVGLPACGKSAYFARHQINTLSSDTLRHILLDDETDQSRQHYVFSALRSLLRLRLLAGRPVSYLDATNLTRRERAPYFTIARNFECLVDAMYFDVPLEVCLERNRNRPRRVPEEAIRAMAAKLEPPTLVEGFRQIVVVGD